MTDYITKRIKVIFMCVFEGILANRSPPFLDFLGLLLVFVEIMPDEVILDHKTSYLVYFENFYFLWFFHLWPDVCTQKKLGLGTQTQNQNPKPKNVYTQTQNPKIFIPKPKTQTKKIFWVQTSAFGQF